jgi:hypothetical protein
LIKKKIPLYQPDLILYYEAINDAFRVTNFLVDEFMEDKISRIGREINSFRSWIHHRLHYRWLSYTYVVEKYYLIKFNRGVKLNKSDFLITDGFEDDIKGIINDTKEKNINLIFVKQVIRTPVNLGSINSLDGNQIKKLYDQSLDPNFNFEKNKDYLVSINQRYILYLIEKIAKKTTRC